MALLWKMSLKGNSWREKATHFWHEDTQLALLLVMVVVWQSGQSKSIHMAYQDHLQGERGPRRTTAVNPDKVLNHSCFGGRSSFSDPIRRSDHESWSIAPFPWRRPQRLKPRGLVLVWNSPSRQSFVKGYFDWTSAGIFVTKKKITFTLREFPSE